MISTIRNFSAKLRGDGTQSIITFDLRHLDGGDTMVIPPDRVTADFGNPGSVTVTVTALHNYQITLSSSVAPGPNSGFEVPLTLYYDS